MESNKKRSYMLPLEREYCAHDCTLIAYEKGDIFEVSGIKYKSFGLPHILEKGVKIYFKAKRHDPIQYVKK